MCGGVGRGSCRFCRRRGTVVRREGGVGVVRDCRGSVPRGVPEFSGRGRSCRELPLGQRGRGAERARAKEASRRRGVSAGLGSANAAVGLGRGAPAGWNVGGKPATLHSSRCPIRKSESKTGGPEGRPGRRNPACTQQSPPQGPCSRAASAERQRQSAVRASRRRNRRSSGRLGPRPTSARDGKGAWVTVAHVSVTGPARPVLRSTRPGAAGRGSQRPGGRGARSARAGG